MSEELSLIREEIVALESLVPSIRRKRTEARLRQYVHSLLNIKESLVRLKRKLRRLPAEEDAQERIETENLIDEMLDAVSEQELGVENCPIKELEDELAALRSIFSEVGGSFPIEQMLFLVDFSVFPREIREEVELDLDEVRRCYLAYAYRSAIAMCGQILQVFLARKYYESKGVDPIQENWLLGVLIGKCIKELVIEEPHLADICNLINRTRIRSVHSSHRIFVPSPEETKSLIEFTIGLGKRLFSRNSTQPQ